MKEISLNILDITQNSVAAGADHIILTVDSRGRYLSFSLKDNGCGMSEDMVDHLTDPFTTTRTTRKFGLGIPLLYDAVTQTGGDLKIESQPGVGTTLMASFVQDNIDCPPLGDMAGAISLIIQSIGDNVNFEYHRITDKGVFEFTTDEIKTVLGDDISLREPDILMWIQSYVSENEAEIK